MSDTVDEDFTKAFEGFGDDDKLSPEEPTETPVNPSPETKTGEEPTGGEKKEDSGVPASGEAPKADDKQEEEGTKPPEAPATPPTPEAPVETPQPLTKDDVQSVVSDLLNTERNSSKELETTTKEVLDAYYPDGLSNILVDEKSGKELRTPQDVVDATDGQMSSEEAAQWLMNEQFKLDQSVAKIKDDAKAIAETTVNFKRDSVTVLQKYEPLFKAYPQLQNKVFDKLMKQVKVDKDKGVILSAPDVMEHYDDYLEPYQQAFEYATKTSATNPTTPATPEPPKPTAEDRMDEGGDGGITAADDPTDFAQQVSKELAKGI